MDRVIANLEELEVVAAAFAAQLSPKASGATLVTLSGDLGAGKTAFTKALGKALGVEGSITSPTFVLEKIYLLTNKPFKRLAHIDAYRLEDSAELASLGFDELMSDNETLVVLEWPENVADTLPKADIALRIQMKEDGSRTISYA